MERAEGHGLGWSVCVIDITGLEHVFYHEEFSGYEICVLTSTMLCFLYLYHQTILMAVHCDPNQTCDSPCVLYMS